MNVFDIIDRVEEVRDTVRREYRYRTPWLTRGELRERLIHLGLDNEQLARDLLSEGESKRYHEVQNGVLQRDLTKADILLRELCEGLGKSADVTARAVADIMERIPDHEPQEAERARVVGGLASEHRR